MRVVMLRARFCTPDGFFIRLFHEHQEYELEDGAARWLVARGYAREAGITIEMIGEDDMAENPTRALLRVSQPEAEAITLAEAKLYLRIDGDEEDALIGHFISAVREAAEEYLRKSLVSQRWRVTYEDYAPLHTPLPRGPVQEVVEVKRRSKSGVETVIAATQYHLNARADVLHFESIVMAHEVDILYEAGYGEGDVPASIRQGMLLHLAVLYEQRSGEGGMPPASICLYKPHREVRF